MDMFCYQCEQTWAGRGCDKLGVCGKDAATATLQDLLVHAAKGISQYAHRAARLGARDRDIDIFVIEALFTTGTNVNFDPERIHGMLRKAVTVRGQARRMYEEACRASDRHPETMNGPAQWIPASNLAALTDEGATLGIRARQAARGDDLAGLQELLTYGIKGMAAYADHALALGKEDKTVYAFLHEALDYLTQPDLTVDGLFAMNLRCGEVNL
jgi:hydroxylamine reductase